MENVKNSTKICDDKCPKKRYPYRNNRAVILKRKHPESNDKQEENKRLSQLLNETGSTKKAKQSPVTPLDGIFEVKVLLERDSQLLTNYFNFSDIEEDAFHLANYVESVDNAKNTSQKTNATNQVSSNLSQESFEQILHNMPLEQTPTVNEINSSLLDFALESQSEMMMTDVNLTGFEYDLKVECLASANIDISDTNIFSEDLGQDLRTQVDENCTSTENTSHNIISESSTTPCNVTDVYFHPDATNFTVQNELNNNQRMVIQSVKGGVCEKTNEEVGPRFNLPSTSVNTISTKTASHTTPYTSVKKTAANLPSASLNTISTKAASHTTLYISLTKSAALKRQMMLLFNRPCYKYLNGKVCGNACKFNHRLPSAQSISEKLLRSSNDTIMYMYSNFIVKSNISFVTYFPIICDIFGSRKMESSLLSAIKDCEQRDKKQFFKCIYHALVTAGLSKQDALSKIIDYGCNNRGSFDIFIEIIIENDPLYFIDMLKKYYRYANIGSYHIRKLLQQVIDTPLPSILTVFIDILDQYSMYDICDLEMFKFVLLRTKSILLRDDNLSERLHAIELRSK